MAFGIDDAIGAGLSIINKFIPDPAAKAQAEAEYRAQVLAASTATDVAQDQTNTAEAANTNLFVAGWRPFIGWVCALALGYQYLVVPLMIWLCIARGLPSVKPPVLDDSLWQLMFGMLGMGTLRTYEKVKRITK